MDWEWLAYTLLLGPRWGNLNRGDGDNSPPPETLPLKGKGLLKDIIVIAPTIFKECEKKSSHRV